MDAKNSFQGGCDASTTTGESPASIVQMDPAAASAALEQAVKSAKQGLKPSGPIPLPEPKAEIAAPRRFPAPARLLAQAAFALVLVGAGWSASYMGTLANREAFQKLETETARSREMLARLSSDLDGLRNTVLAFKEIEHTSSTVSASSQSKLADKVERLTVALQEPGKRLSSLEDRIGRMEGQITTTLASLNTKPAAPTPSPVPTPPEAPPREEAAAPKTVKAEPVDGWVLREVYDGSALVESRNGRLYEVAPGGQLPGVGRIGSIERRGTRWVVLTDKGFIGTYR
jgi:hypothetical protein